MTRRDFLGQAHNFFMRFYMGRHIKEIQMEANDNLQFEDETLTDEAPAPPGGEDASDEQAEEEAPAEVETPVPVVMQPVQPAKTAAEILMAGAAEVQNALADAASARAQIALADNAIHDAEMFLEEARMTKNKAADKQRSTLIDAQLLIDEQIARLQRQSERLGNEIAGLA